MEPPPIIVPFVANFDQYSFSLLFQLAQLEFDHPKGKLFWALVMENIYESGFFLYCVNFPHSLMKKMLLWQFRHETDFHECDLFKILTRDNRKRGKDEAERKEDETMAKIVRNALNKLVVRLVYPIREPGDEGSTDFRDLKTHLGIQD